MLIGRPINSASRTQLSIQNFTTIIILLIVLCIGTYYRLLAMDSNIRIRNGFEKAVSIASYLFKDPAMAHQGSHVKPEHIYIDSFPLGEYYSYADGAADFTFVRNPDMDALKRDSESRSELGWSLILRYVLPNDMKGSKNMALRIVKFTFAVELILIILLFFIGKKVMGLVGATFASLSYAIFSPAVHLMTYVTYYYWAIPFVVLSLFFWLVLYEDKRVQNNLKVKIALFFFYGAVMGFGAATRLTLLLLPLFMSPFIFSRERKIKLTALLIMVMLCGQFTLLLPQMMVNKMQFGKFAVTTRDSWHAVITGLGFYKNPFGITDSGDIIVYNYIRKTTGIDYYKDGMNAYDEACKRQVIKMVKEYPKVFISNAFTNIKSAKLVNFTAFYGIDTPINKALSLDEIQKSRLQSVPLLEKYFLWLILLAFVLSRMLSEELFRKYLIIIAHNAYLIFVICLYFPNYLYYMSGYTASWVLLFSLSLAVVIVGIFLFTKKILFESANLFHIRERNNATRKRQ